MNKTAQNEWQLSNGRWDWPKIRTAYIAGRWPDYEMAARELGINPTSQIRKHGADENWNGQRTALEQRAEEQARARILGRLTREFEKRLAGMLDTADVLRYKALQTLGDDLVRLSPHDAIRAAATATDIEREIFLRRGRPIDGGDPEHPNPVDSTPPNQPGLLAAPTTLSELNDAHLVRIIDQAQPAAVDLAGGVEKPQDGDHAPRSSSRRTKAKGGKG